MDSLTILILHTASTTRQWQPMHLNEVVLLPSLLQLLPFWDEACCVDNDNRSTC